MKKDVLFIVLMVLTCTLVFGYICLSPNQVEGHAENGVLDLRGTGLAETTFRLTGEWLVSFNGGEQTAVNFPHSQSLFDFFGYSVGDTAAYTLTVLTDRDLPMDLFIPEIDDSCEIWVNGKMLFATDKVQTAFVSFTPQNGVSVIEMISTKHIEAKNGMRNSVPEISISPYLDDIGLKQRVVCIFILGGFLMIGIYHLLLYRFSPKDKVYLVFALMCVFEVGQMLFEYHGIISWIWPIHINTYYQVYLLMVCLHGICMCVFTSLVFPLRYNKMEMGFITLMFGMTILLVLILPVNIGARSILLGYLPMLLYVIKIFTARSYQNNRSLLLYLASLLLFMLSGIVKITIEELYDIYMFPLICGLFMILSQCYLLSRNYMKVMLDVEKLNENLEIQVRERTYQLAHANEVLTISQNALKEMIGNISHDLKTPLTVLGQYLELLDDGNINLEDAERSDYIHVAYHKNLTMQRLIRNLFEATRIETGQLNYNLEWLPLSELVNDIEDRHGKYLRDLGLRFTVESADDCRVRLDHDKIWSVIDNIIYNAARHTPQNGEIIITAGIDGGKCVIGIADTGEGIAEEHLPNIFDKFYKVSKARNTGGDSGMGLYIARTMAEGMGGSISVQSRLGEGTKFLISLEAEIIL